MPGRLRRLLALAWATRVLCVAATLLAVSIPSRLVAQSFWVYPDGNSLTKPIKSTHSTDFGLVNLVSGKSYYREILCSGQVTNCNSSTPEQFTAPLAGITVNFTTTSSGSARVRLKVYEYIGGPADTGWYNVTVEAMHAGIDVMNNDKQDLSLCANSCFGATYAQSTVPYYSLDTPRQVTLVYHGDRSSLLPFVHADVAPAPGAPTPAEYWLVAKVNNDSVVFINEGTGKKIRFSGSSQRVRLGGQFSAASYMTGVYPMDVIVTARYSDGSTDQTAFATTLLTVDERQSRIARGWSIAGLQRIYGQGDGSLVITEGDGSAAYFAYSSGCSCYTSPSGDFSKLTSTGSGHLRAYPDSTNATFNTAGQLTRIADRFGNATDFEYDGSGRLSKIYDPIRTYNGGASRSYILLTYGAYGLAQIQEPGPDGSPSGGRITTIGVAADSTLQLFKDPDGDSAVFGYDSNRRLSTITDRRGGLTTYNYDPASGKLASVDLPQVTLFDGTSARPRTQYSPWHTASVPTGSTATTPFTPMATANVRGSATDPLGRQSSFSTDHWGQPLKITDPIGRTTTVTRTGIHPSSIQSPTGAIDYLSFSGALLTSVTPSGETQQQVRYAAWAQPDSVWGSGRPSQRYFIGPQGRVDSTRVGGVDSLKTKYYYDNRGRVDSIVDAGGHVTRYHYHPQLGNLDSTLAPGNRFTKLSFDGYGRLQTQTSNDEPQRSVVYDALNRVREVYDGVNAAPTKYTYDQLYLTRVQDPKGQIFRFENNALGWVTKRFDPADTLGRYDSYGYDVGGNALRWTNRRGQQLSFVYDSFNRLTSKSGTNTTSSSYRYSTDGRKVAASNAISTDTVYLAQNGWVDSVVTVISGKRFATMYRPNNVGQLDTVRVATDAGITFAQRRFGWNRTTGTLDTVVVNGQTTRFTHNRELLPVQTIWPSLSRTEQWTAIHRPGEQSFSDATVNTALFRRYSYDSHSNLRDRIRWDGTNFRTRQSGYDGLRRLGNQGDNLYSTSQCPWDAASGYLCPLSFQRQVTYDAAGNRTDGTNVVYTAGNRIESFNNYTFTHDADGNVTQKYNSTTGERKNFEWSAEGLLTRVLLNGTERVRYDYDAGGRLVRRSTNGAIDRHFLWDQGHLLAELDASATQRVGEYAYLPGADQPLALITGAQAIGTIRYLVQDEVGNVIGTLNGTTLDQQVSYDDWGVPTVTGHAENRLLFKGLLWESNYTGMYYVRARWYDPELGRFVTEDPVGIADGLNVYTFAGNDAINGWDPSGRWKFKNFLRSVLQAAPIAAFAAITYGASLPAAVNAMGATIIGSAASATIEHAYRGTKFVDAFQRNLGISSLGFLLGTAVGGGIASAGAKNPLQGFIRTNRADWGAITLGSGAIFDKNRLTGEGKWLVPKLLKYSQHEFGHTVQFLYLSALPGVAGLGPWIPYLALGGIGLAGQYGGSPVGCVWEGLADRLGGGGAFAACPH